MHNLGKVFVAGHRGMAGSAIVRNLKKHGDCSVVFKTRQELDLMDYTAVLRYIESEKPDIVVVAAARVGGILANNTYPVEFFTENIMTAINLIRASYEAKVNRLLFLGSSCIYPQLAPQPIEEEALLTGPLEPTNEAYALAKIGGLKLCEYYRRQYEVCYHSVMPTNLYGPGDNYHIRDSHAFAALIRKFHEAKVTGASEVKIWGTGKPRREFLHVDDFAEAVYQLLICDNPPDVVNVGWGEDISIEELANEMKEAIGFKGHIVFDSNYPGGTPRKLLNTSLISQLGWFPNITLKEGIRRTYQDFLQEMANGTLRCEEGSPILAKTH